MKGGEIRARAEVTLYGADYPYLQEMLANWGKASYRLWWLCRTLSEVWRPLRLRKGDRILEVGCGIGQISYFLRKVGIATFGLDIDVVALEHSQNLFGRNSKNNALACGDARFLPFRDGQFQAVISYDLLEHLANEEALQQVFQEMARVCKGARMLHKVTVLEEAEALEADETHRIRWEADSWARWFRSQGWEVKTNTTRYTPIWSRKKIGLSSIFGYFLLERA